MSFYCSWQDTKCSRALQEWNLLHDEEKGSYEDAFSALCNRLKYGSKTLAALDFHHTAQKEDKHVSKFIHHLKGTFKIAYGCDHMSTETWDTELHGKAFVRRS